MKINKILIANRGEIAVRIIRTLKQLGKTSVAVYAANDAQSMHVELADEAWLLEGETLKDTYLHIDKIINTALKSGADAIHPGYGFLSENPLFAEACTRHGLIFIGPSSENIRLMGNKIAARETAIRFGLPVTKGLSGDVATLIQNRAELQFPVLLKAAAGGGGKGMRIVHDAGELPQLLEATSREAARYFGDGSVYMEEFIEKPRHIEVQVLADSHGHVVHLGERECSIQRRYQKIIEESPSASLTPELRATMGAAAVQLCRGIHYRNAGTIEFLLDQQNRFYFLEMNTRIQVEHPVTEMVTGIDLVAEQISIAEGRTLSFGQESVRQQGHAIECRIYAEDPLRDFLPAPGQISYYREPSGEGIRNDSSLNKTGEISSFYDPLISKLICHAPTRAESINLMHKALKNFQIQGIQTNIPYLSALIRHPQFVENNISTGFCEQHTDDLIQLIENEKKQIPTSQIIAAFLLVNPGPALATHQADVWKNIGYWRNQMIFGLQIDNELHELEIVERNSEGLIFLMAENVFDCRLLSLKGGQMQYGINEQLVEAVVSTDEKGNCIVQLGVHQYAMRRTDQLQAGAHQLFEGDSSTQGSLFAPMPGKVIKVAVSAGAVVQRGSLLVVVEAMKMENNIIAPHEAVVDVVNVKVGDMVDTKTQLVHLREIEN